MYSLSNYYKEPAIFKNVLDAFIVSIISVVVVFVLEFGAILSALTGISPTNTPPAVTPAFTQIILTFVVVLVAALAFAIVNGLLYMRAFNKLGEKSGIDNFETTRILYIIGAIIPLVTWIVWIFAALAFNKLKSLPTTATVSGPKQSQSITMHTKRCPNCGTENLSDVFYCSLCGKPLQ